MIHPLSKGPILLLDLSFFHAYVKKYLGFDFKFSIAHDSFTKVSSSYEFNNFLSILPMAFSIRFFRLGRFLFCSSLFGFFFFLNKTLLSLGILFECVPRGFLNVVQFSSIILMTISNITFSFY